MIESVAVPLHRDNGTSGHSSEEGTIAERADGYIANAQL